MTPDGTVVVARVAADGDLEVRERPPGGPFGETIALGPPAEPGGVIVQVQVLTVADGSAAVVVTTATQQVVSLREPGGRWTPPAPAFAGPGPVALGPGAALWGVAPAATGDRLAVYRFTGTGPASSTPLPLALARHGQNAIAVAPDGHATVAFDEFAASTFDGDACATRSKLQAVDVSAGGDLGSVQTLDDLEASGRIPIPGFCIPVGGALASLPLVAFDAAGATTVAWNRQLPNFQAMVMARHRAAGAPWAVQAPPDEIGESLFLTNLLGGAGDPLVIVAYEFGRLLTTLGPDGHWTPLKPLVRQRTFQVARTGAGGAVFAWPEGSDLVGQVLDPEGRLGERTTIAAAAETDAVVAVGADAQGNAVALASQKNGDADELRTYGYDAAGPRVTKLTVPEHPVAGVPALFSAAGIDVWSGAVSDATWDFGDGAVEDGNPRPHAYVGGGSRTVAVRLRDATGNETRATAGIVVAEAPPAPEPLPAPTTPPPPPRDLRAPRVTAVSVTPRRPHTTRPGLLQLTLDEAGRAQVVLTKEARGIRRGKRCVARTKSGGRACTRRLARRTVTKSLAAGEQRISLPRLSAGNWHVRLEVTDAAGNASRPRTLTVRVTR